ncbi:MAG: type II toxin-antitoxin system Phd/YefM family antitoxin [Alteromonadaceae bacterium]|nr:type II toxin-antitoxin system Phd/YefM family antitoxin [Alteromonadaceae bacterium]
MNTETITYLKENANQLELDEALTVTKNGKPSFVVQSYQSYQDMQDNLALLKTINLSEKSASKNGFLSLDQAFADE